MSSTIGSNRLVFRGRRLGDLEVDRQLVLAVHQEVQLEAEPLRDLLPRGAVLVLSALRLHTPVRIRVCAAVRLAIRPQPDGVLLVFLAGGRERRERLAVDRQERSQVRQVDADLLDQVVEHLPDRALVRKERVEEVRVGPRRRDREDPADGIEAAQLAELAVSGQLPAERLDAGVLVHHSGQDRVPRGANRVVVPPVAALRLQNQHQRLIGNRCQHEAESIQIGRCIDIAPVEQRRLWYDGHE